MQSIVGFSVIAVFTLFHVFSLFFAAFPLFFFVFPLFSLFFLDVFPSFSLFLLFLLFSFFPLFLIIFGSLDPQVGIPFPLPLQRLQRSSAISAPSAPRLTVPPFLFLQIKHCHTPHLSTNAVLPSYPTGCHCRCYDLAYLRTESTVAVVVVVRPEVRLYSVDPECDCR